MTPADSVTDGDRELWLLEVHCFCIPLLCTPYLSEGKRYFLCETIEPMNQEAAAAARNHLESSGCAPAGSSWIVLDQVIRSVLRKAPGITPEFYSKGDWCVPCGTTEVSANEGFIRSVWRRTSVADLDVVRAVWMAIIQEIPVWLLSSMKPLDLGWFKIVALPYRLNWKLNVAAKFPRMHRILTKDGQFKHDLIEYSGMSGDLLSTANIELRKTGKHFTFGWTPEIVTSQAWDRYVSKFELDRARASTPSSYLRIWGGLVQRLRSRICEVLLHYCRQTSRPAGSLAANRGFRGASLVPYVRPGKITPSGLDSFEADLVSDLGFDAITSPGQEGSEGDPDAAVPEVRVVRPPEEDLWDAGRDVPGPGDGV